MTPAELKQARRKLGLTQEQLAPLLGYGLKDRVSKLECGVERPGAAVLLLYRVYLAGPRPPVLPPDWP